MPMMKGNPVRKEKEKNLDGEWASIFVNGKPFRVKIRR
ncbi:Uncharacterised protein [uncultured archaeon]|nr:Uncharacterised protein [uncultured archaeon]